MFAVPPAAWITVLPTLAKVNELAVMAAIQNVVKANSGITTPQLAIVRKLFSFFAIIHLVFNCSNA